MPCGLKNLFPSLGFCNFRPRDFLQIVCALSWVQFPKFPTVVFGGFGAALGSAPLPLLRTPKEQRAMKQEMFINVAQPEECRVAVVEDGVLEEFYIERASQENYIGNIYKGVVVNLEPSIQAAFVDFGVGRNGFLHISDVEPQYFRLGGLDPKELEAAEASGNGSRGRSRNRNPSGRPRLKPPIQDIFRRGDEVLVQIIKEGIGNKGPTLSTYISIPGRYLVLMPALGRVGVSRKIEDLQQRRHLRQILHELDLPPGLGFIVRTAGADRTKRELQRDLAYLLRLWRVIVRRIKNSRGPVAIYEESDMIIRTIRDIFTADVEAIYIDEPQAYERAKEFLQMVMPRYVNRLHLYEGKKPLFHHFGIEKQIQQIHQREVPLKSGGSIVIDQTEALVAIDVNSGNFRAADESAEETAYQINLMAAREIARQIRLRDLGGVIVNDFIDMRLEKHRRGVERALREALKRDRARSRILRTSPFGLIEMTRQRIRPSLRWTLYRHCPTCMGSGMVKTVETLGLELIRTLVYLSQDPKVRRIVLQVAPDVAGFLNNQKRHQLTQLEEENQVTIQILAKEGAHPELADIQCQDAEGNPVPVEL